MAVLARVLPVLALVRVRVLIYEVLVGPRASPPKLAQAEPS